MRFAGCAEAARRHSLGLFLAAAVLASGPALGSPPAQRWYAEGVKALDEGRFADAQAALLKAVEADPGFAGAWLDLAIASHAAGDTVQAEEFLSILEARFVLPEPIAAGVAALRHSIRDQDPPGPLVWNWRAVAQGGAGYDSNANAGLAVNDLTLTLPGGGVSLPIASALKPQGDAYAVASLVVDGWRRHGTGQLEAGASLKARRNARVTEFDTLEAQASVGYASNAPAFEGVWARWLPGPWRVGAAVQQSRLGGSTLFNSFSLSGVHAWTQLPCSPQGSVEWTYRSFPTAPNLDSRLAWLGLGAACPSDKPGSRGGWNLHGRLGHEGAKNAFVSNQGRPGGDTWHVEAGITRHWRWAGPRGPQRLEALVQWAGARDTEGYSPLLANNARRHVQRATAGIAYTFPLVADAGEDDWLGTVTVQGFRQTSNLGLFRLKGVAAQFTMQWAW